MKFYKAYILFGPTHSYHGPTKFDVDIYTQDGKKMLKALEYGGCVGSNKIYKISEYDEDDNISQLAFFCSDYDTILNFWDGFLSGAMAIKLNQSIEFSRN